jgi:hypothetical protein
LLLCFLNNQSFLSGEAARDVPLAGETVPKKQIDFSLASFNGYLIAIFFFPEVRSEGHRIRNAEE